MKKILLINKEVPYPPHKNGVCNTLFHLVKEWQLLGYEITIIYLGKYEKENEEVLKEKGIVLINKNILGKELFIEVDKRRIMKPRNSWNLNSKYFSEIDVSEFEYVFIGSLMCVTIVNKLKNLNFSKAIFFEADSLAMYYQRCRYISNIFHRKLYYLIQEKTIKKLEKSIYPKFKKIVFVSDVDKRFVEEYYKSSKLEISKIGIKVFKEKNRKKYKKDIVDIGFSGIMDYEPNKMAAEYIINKLLPKLEKKDIQYKVHLIGKNPAKEWFVEEKKQKGKLIITGFIENIDTYISEMDIYISPLFLGSGMKNKILQAMGLGLPIIASKVSVEGIEELENNENFLLCDENVENWINSIEKLCRDEVLRRDFGEKVRDIIEENYLWSKIAKKILKVEDKE